MVSGPIGLLGEWGSKVILDPTCVVCEYYHKEIRVISIENILVFYR